jgi:hypothetical protein
MPDLSKTTPKKAYRYSYGVEDPKAKIISVQVYPGMVSNGFDLEQWATHSIADLNGLKYYSAPQPLRSHLQNLQDGLAHLEGTQTNWSFMVVLSARASSPSILKRKIGDQNQAVGMGTGGFFQYDPPNGYLNGIRWDFKTARFEVTGIQASGHWKSAQAR